VIFVVIIYFSFLELNVSVTIARADFGTSSASHGHRGMRPVVREACEIAKAFEQFADERNDALNALVSELWIYQVIWRIPEELRAEQAELGSTPTLR
jgi:hypothetical protein